MDPRIHCVSPTMKIGLIDGGEKIPGRPKYNTVPAGTTAVPHPRPYHRTGLDSTTSRVRKTQTPSSLGQRQGGREDAEADAPDQCREDDATARMSQQLELRRLAAEAEIDEANRGLHQRIDDIFGEHVELPRATALASSSQDGMEAFRPGTVDSHLAGGTASLRTASPRQTASGRVVMMMMGDNRSPATKGLERVSARRSSSISNGPPEFPVMAPTPDTLRSLSRAHGTTAVSSQRRVPGSPRTHTGSATPRPVSQSFQFSERAVSSRAMMSAVRSGTASSHHHHSGSVGHHLMFPSGSATATTVPPNVIAVPSSITEVPLRVGATSRSSPHRHGGSDSSPAANALSTLPIPFEQAKFQSIIAWAEMSFEEAVIAARGPKGPPSHIPTSQLQSRPSRVLTAACCAIVDEIMRHLPFRSTALWDTMKEEIFGAVYHHNYYHDDQERRGASSATRTSHPQNGDNSDPRSRLDTWFARVMAPQTFWFDECDELRRKLAEADRKISVYTQYAAKYERIFDLQHRQFTREMLKRSFTGWRAVAKAENVRRAQFCAFADHRHDVSRSVDAFSRWRHFTTVSKFRTIRNQISSESASKEAMLKAKRLELQQLQRNLEDERERLKASVEREAKRSNSIVATHQVEVREMKSMQIAKDNIIVHLEKIAKRWERLAKTYRPPISALRHLPPSRSLVQAARVALESEEGLIMKGPSGPRLTKAREDLELILLAWVNDILKQNYQQQRAAQAKHAAAARQSLVSSLTNAPSLAAVDDHSSRATTTSTAGEGSTSALPAPPPAAEFKPITNLTTALRDGDILMQVAKHVVRRTIPDAYKDGEQSLFSVVSRALYLGTSQGMAPPLISHCSFHHRFFTADTFLEVPHPTGAAWILASLLVTDVLELANGLPATATAAGVQRGGSRAPLVTTCETLMQAPGLSSLGLMMSSRFEIDSMPRPKNWTRNLQQRLQQLQEKEQELAVKADQAYQEAALRPQVSGNPFCNIFLEDTESDLEAFFESDEDDDGTDNVVLSPPTSEDGGACHSRSMSPEEHFHGAVDHQQQLSLAIGAPPPLFPSSYNNYHSNGGANPGAARTASLVSSKLTGSDVPSRTPSATSDRRSPPVGGGGGGPANPTNTNNLPQLPTVAGPTNGRRRLSAVRVIDGTSDGIEVDAPFTVGSSAPTSPQRALESHKASILLTRQEGGALLPDVPTGGAAVPHSAFTIDRRTSMISESSMTPTSALTKWNRSPPGSSGISMMTTTVRDSQDTTAATNATVPSVRSSADRSAAASSATTVSLSSSSSQGAFGKGTVPIESSAIKQAQKDHSRRIPAVREDLRQVPMSRLLRLLRGEDENRVLWYSLGRLVTSLVVRFRVLDVDVPVKPGGRSGTNAEESLSGGVSGSVTVAPLPMDRRRSTAVMRRGSVARGVLAPASSNGSEAATHAATPRGGGVVHRGSVAFSVNDTDVRPPSNSSAGFQRQPSFGSFPRIPHAEESAAAVATEGGAPSPSVAPRREQSVRFQ